MIWYVQMSLGLTILRKDSLMRKNIGCLVVAVAAVFASGAKADLYQECLDKHYMSDNEMAGCNEAEADRIMGEIRKRMNSIAATSYFNNWNSSRKDFTQLLDNWVEFRDKYCDLYGYTYTQDLGTISNLQRTKCQIDMNKRFLDDVEAIVKIYQENA